MAASSISPSKRICTEKHMSTDLAVYFCQSHRAYNDLENVLIMGGSSEVDSYLLRLLVMNIRHWWFPLQIWRQTTSYFSEIPTFSNIPPSGTQSTLLGKRYKRTAQDSSNSRQNILVADNSSMTTSDKRDISRAQEIKKTILNQGFRRGAHCSSYIDFLKFHRNVRTAWFI